MFNRRELLVGSASARALLPFDLPHPRAIGRLRPSNPVILTGESTAGILDENPFVKFFNGQRGYVTCALSTDQLKADYRIVEYVSQPDSPISTRASFSIENGKPGAQRL